MRTHLHTAHLATSYLQGKLLTKLSPEENFPMLMDTIEHEYEADCETDLARLRESASNVRPIVGPSSWGC